MLNEKKELIIKKNNQLSQISKNNSYYNINLEQIKDVLKEGSTILNLSFFDKELIESIEKYLNNKCNIINFFNDSDNNLYILIKEFFKNKNILFNKTEFTSNFLKNNSIDIVLARNFLGNNNKKNILELQRILKTNGILISLELFSTKPPKNGFKRYFNKHKGNIFNKIIFEVDSKLKIVKNFKYDIKIVSNGNFYFTENDIKNLQDFCDEMGLNTQDRENIISDVFLVLIKCYINKN